MAFREVGEELEEVERHADELVVESGRMVRVGPSDRHECATPDGKPVGSIWECDCGVRWIRQSVPITGRKPQWRRTYRHERWRGVPVWLPAVVTLSAFVACFLVGPGTGWFAIPLFSTILGTLAAIFTHLWWVDEVKS